MCGDGQTRDLESETSCYLLVLTDLLHVLGHNVQDNPTALISTAGVDSVFILLSYVLIIRTVLSIASPEERKKAFSTCISHIGAVAVFYIPLLSLSFVHRFAKRAPPYVHTLVANAYLLTPPVLNPIIYSVKTKQIRKAVLKVLHSSMAKS